MVQIIGIMVGFYIIAKMIALALRSHEAPFARVFAMLTVIIAIAGLYLLLRVGGADFLPGAEP